MSKLLRFTFFASFVFLTACAEFYSRDDIAPPADRYEVFHPVSAGGDGTVRQFEDEFESDEPVMKASFVAALRQVPKRRGLNILALSGGGQHGAYGAGFLNGWTESGRRPQFDIVTGISTGAIIAPFAFLGSDYDQNLKRFYTQTSTSDLIRWSPGVALFGKGFLANTSPLRAIIGQEMSDEVIQAIAIEHGKGRRLFVGTTHLDAERPMLWDIGALASLGTDQSKELIRDVILASASIPVLFQPVTIQVTDGVDLKEELHVDGGLTREIFAYPYDLDLKALLRQLGLSRRQNRIWMIHNKKLDPTYAAQVENAGAIARRSFELLIRSQGIGNIQGIMLQAASDRLTANLTWIPAEFEEKPEEPFDQSYMEKLFTFGQAAGSQNDAWLYDLNALLQ